MKRANDRVRFLGRKGFERIISQVFEALPALPGAAERRFDQVEETPQSWERLRERLT